MGDRVNHIEPIDCEQVLSLLFAYLDGEVQPDESQSIDAHLERCRSCFSRAEFERGLRARLADLSRGEVSATLEQRIRRLMQELVATQDN